MMNAKSILVELAQRFADLRLDAVMIGNAAAAFQGAPVTTLDIDFMVKWTDDNYKKLALLAQQMKCLFIEMKLPGDNYMYRLENREKSIYIDFLFVAAGIESFEGLKERGMDVFFGEHSLRIASLEDILASKRMAGRPKDLAVLPILEMTLDENEDNKSKTEPAPIRYSTDPRWPDDLPKPIRVDEDPDRHLIRSLLSIPPNERTNFLRVPLPNGGSAI